MVFFGIVIEPPKGKREILHCNAPKYKQIVLIDDDNILLDLYASELESRDLSQYLTSFDNAREGINYLKRSNQEEQPDYILLDLYMPEMDGFEFLRQISGIKKINDSVEIYVCTSSKSEEDRKRAMAFPLVSAFLEKPLPEKFLEFLIHS